jgi:hypothetical protein
VEKREQLSYTSNVPMEQTPLDQTYPEDHSLRNEEELPGATWTAPEYHHSEKTKDWYWGVCIISLTIVIISFIIGNWLFALLVLVATFTLVLFAHRPPKEITIHMGSTGIIIEKTLYEYEDLESFWVDTEENPAHPKILFKSKKVFMPFIIVPLGDLDPNDVADFLIDYLPEEKHKEPLLQRLAEDFGF